MRTWFSRSHGDGTVVPASVEFIGNGGAKGTSQAAMAAITWRLNSMAT